MSDPDFVPRSLSLLDALDSDSSSVTRARDSDAAEERAQGHVERAMADGGRRGERR